MSVSASDDELESHGADIGRRTGSRTRLSEWVLVNGNRLLLAGVISLAVFVLLVALSWLGVIGFVNDDSITRLAGGMIAGAFSLVTLVVSVNQLILSREFTAAGEASDRVDRVLAFREDIEAATDTPASPAEPAKLLELLVVSIGDTAARLDDHVAAERDEDLTALIEDYAASIESSTRDTRETLAATEFGTFDALSAAVDYDDSWQLHVARHLRKRHGDVMTAETQAALDQLLELLRLFNVTREHVKTTYMQRELTRFSQLTILTGVPAVLAALLLGLMYAAFRGAAIPLDVLPVVAPVLITVVVTPLSLLAAYILRIATVTRRTASIGPMIPEKSPETGPFEVDVEPND